MSHFTEIMPSNAPMSGAVSDTFTQNALCLGGTATLAGVGVMSVALTATVLPGQTLGLGALGVGALVWGNHIASDSTESTDATDASDASD